MATLPIRKLILYKQGIGYFTRQGTIDEQTIDLVIPRRATNDVLKSLNVQVEGGGQVLSVDYETPTGTDKSRDTAMALSDRSSLVDLLAGLRGTVVTVQVDDAEIDGRIIGVETLSEVDDGQASLILQSVDGENISIHMLDEVKGFRLHDAKAQRDVGFYLDMSQTETTRMTLTVRVSDDVETLSIDYLAPSPVWRVSYRLVGAGNGTARLVGWGLFDNSIGEDLEDVDLTLMSGRPISFEYLLNESKVTPRPQVADDAEMMQALSRNPQVAQAFRSISHDLRSPASNLRSAVYLLEQTGNLNDEQKQILQMIEGSANSLNTMLDDLLDIVNLREEEHESYGHSIETYGTSPLGDLKVSGSYFVPMQMGSANAEYMVYNVENLVTVRRGQSAMVPIINTQIEYEELLVYNRDKMPNHPLRVWQFTNSTGFALEQGPVTIADAQYLGDGLLRFTGVGDDIQIPYALHFGIIITEKTERDDETLFAFEVDYERRWLVPRFEQISHVIYTMSSRVDEDNTLLIEWRNPRSAEFVDMPAPVMERDQHTRWQVEITGNTETDFTVNFRTTRQNNLNVSQIRPEFVELWHDANLLDNGLYDLLQSYLAEKEAQSTAQAEIKNLQEEYNKVVSRQEQLRQNIKTLGTSDRETAIRDRILDDLEASENRRREIDATIETLNTQIEASRATQTETVEAIFTQ